MAQHWWEKVKETLSQSAIDAIHKFMYEGLIKRNLHPTKVARFAFHHDFEDAAVLNLDWEAVSQYYLTFFHSSRALGELAPDKYVVGMSHDTACAKCKALIDNKIYLVSNAPTLPCCDFCRCLLLEWLPKLYYLKDGRVEFAIDEQSELERIQWVKENRDIFAGKFEQHQFHRE